MKTSTLFFTIFLTLFSVLSIIILENYLDDFFFAPIIECVAIFLVVLFVKWRFEDSLFGIVFLVIILFFIFETSVYLISVQLDFINSSMYEVLSWRIVYGGFFTFVWIPITVLGLRYKQKALWFLFLFLGFLVHLIINLMMNSI